jgi:cell division protein FtsL
MEKANKIKAKDIFDGSILTSKWFIKNLSIIIVFAIFFIAYIAVRYQIDHTIKSKNQTIEKIKSLQDKASEQKAILQRNSLMMEVSRKLEERGVKISTEPIKGEIIIPKEVENGQ